MIRSVPIPRTVSRMGDLQMSQGCVTYQDPNTGLWVADGNTNCNQGDGSAPDSPILTDAGAASALATWAVQSSQTSASEAATASLPLPSLVLAESLMSGNIPSPLPGLGLTIPASTTRWLLIGLAVVGGLLLLDSEGSRR